MGNKEPTEEQMQYVWSRIQAIPDIPKARKYWGKEYTSKCPCGGIMTACRNTYNGHIRVSCDKCNFSMME